MAGWLDSLLNSLGSGIGSLAGGLADYGLSALSNATMGLSKAQKQQNAYASAEASAARDFSALEAQRARDFSAAQAEAERDWQEEMYSKYNSLSGKMNQAREAGVNPLFAVTGSAVSPMSAGTSGVSSPSASPVSASPGSIGSPGRVSDMVGSILGFSKIKAEVDLLKSQARSNNAKALRDEILSQFDGQISETSIKESLSRINNTDVDTSVKQEMIGEITSRTLLNSENAKVASAQLGLIAQQIAESKASESLKVGQLQQVFSSIENTDADTQLKFAQKCEVLASTRNLRLTANLIRENVHLARSERKRLLSEYNLLEQKYSHQEIINAYDEIIQKSSASHAEFWDYSNMSGLSQVAAELCKWLMSATSFGGYSSVGRSYNVSEGTSTVTHFDGDHRPKSSRRIGF